MQDVSLSVDGVTGTNSDPDPVAEAEGTATTTVQNAAQQTQSTQSTQSVAGTVNGDLNQTGGTVNSQAAVVQSGVRSTSENAVVNQVLGQDQGMLPVVKGGAGTGLR